jgi:hypothetical protein
MPVREMTPQERKDWLGSGIVMSGFKRPKNSPQPSTSTSEADNSQLPISSSLPVPEDQQILGDGVMKESNEPEIEVDYDSDEFRACELLAKQGTPIEVAISSLIDFHGMAEDESRAYYLDALDQRILGAKDMKKSKELREMEQEDLDSEPSLDKMLDWSNPETYAGLGRLARNLAAKKAGRSPSSSGAKQDKNSTKK